jgi:superoxide dismutase, Cu-Zn family
MNRPGLRSESRTSTFKASVSCRILGDKQPIQLLGTTLAACWYRESLGARMRRVLVFITAALIAAEASYGFGAESKFAKVKMINGNRLDVGEATLSESPSGVLIRLTLRAKPEGISPGTHALHIHNVGKCEPPFKSAGEHFDPIHKKHGFFSKDGKHIGDLPNIHVPENAPLIVEFLVPQLSLGGGKYSLFDSDGSALVIHQGADDYITDPAGNAGDRVACGVIEWPHAK